MSSLKSVVNEILNARSSISSQRSVLVAITGIDASGKGYFTEQLVAALQTKGVRAVAINADAWLNLERFDTSDPAEHYYNNAIRFEEMFAQTIFPLRDRRSLRTEINYADETATEYRRRIYEFEDVDVIALEGIYLLKRPFQTHYDRSIWIDCSFETALERAISRGQEGLPPNETIRDYRTIYVPAQEIHFQRDDPKGVATLIVNNDSRLGPVSWSDQSG
ncbi:MAG: uridine kinase [Chloroflexi bacterium]|nr:uridine kinase [Chloroflexota bacterium]MCH8801845.1 uridine kinase [Chloroflexota bacterium]